MWTSEKSPRGRREAALGLGVLGPIRHLGTKENVSSRKARAGSELCIALSPALSPVLMAAHKYLLK